MDFFNKLKLYFTTQNSGKDFEHEKPENWIWGIFYYSSKDYRFIVPKRNSTMGWTFNFAHPISYIILILIIAAPILQKILTK